MKTLTTEQQQELQDLIHRIPRHNLDYEMANQLDYWSIELKPKRVRKKNITEAGDGGTVIIDGGTTF